MRTQAHSLSKEKLLFLAAALVSAALLYSFIVSRPMELVPGAPLAAQRPEPALLNGTPRELLPEGAYFAGERKSPFVVPPGVSDDGGTKPGQNPAAGENRPAARAQPADSPGLQPDRLYGFAGVVVHDGIAHALLQARADGTTLRAREGTALDGDYTVARVLKQSIELRHRSGRVYVLRDRPVSQ